MNEGILNRKIYQGSRADQRRPADNIHSLSFSLVKALMGRVIISGAQTHSFKATDPSCSSAKALSYITLLHTYCRYLSNPRTSPGVELNINDMYQRVHDMKETQGQHTFTRQTTPTRAHRCNTRVSQPRGGKSQVMQREQ